MILWLPKYAFTVRREMLQTIVASPESRMGQFLRFGLQSKQKGPNRSWKFLFPMLYEQQFNNIHRRIVASDGGRFGSPPQHECLFHGCLRDEDADIVFLCVSVSLW
jgi:hypothetical protein